MRRRKFLMLAAAAVSLHAQSDDLHGTVRIGLTPVFLDDQVAFLDAWRRYLEARLGQSVRFVRRGSYREIIALLRSRDLDYAWVCGYPFVRHARALKLLAVPLFKGRPMYQSYLIVPASDTRTRSILDLRGKAFAFSDPDSNSGYLYPNYLLVSLNERPNGFFGRPFFTWAHRSVVEAVATGLAAGGAVDGYVWDTLDKFQPQLTASTRVVHSSPEFGFPPLVSHQGVDAAAFAGMQRVLLRMSNDPDGRMLMKRLNLDGFAAGEKSLFDGIASMVRVVDGAVDVPTA